MTHQAEGTALEPTSRLAASEPLERNPVITLLHEVLAPTRKYFHTRRLLASGQPLYEYTPAELEAAGAMRPWTFNLTESALASFPALLLFKLLTLLWPLPAVADPGMSELERRAAEYAASIDGAMQPMLVPLVLMLMAGLCARGSLHWRDTTPGRVARARWAYLYIEGARGLVPQCIWSLAAVLWFWSGLRGGLPVPVDIALWLFFLYALVHLSYISLFLLPRLLFAINGYSTRAVISFTPKQKRPANLAPKGRYILTVFVAGFLLLTLLDAVFFWLAKGMGYALATISLRFG